MARPYLGGSSAGIKTLDATQTLSLADSGKTFICSQSSAVSITLPSASSAKGWEGHFILGTAASNAFSIYCNPTDIMFGVSVAENGTNIDGADVVQFASGAATVGDQIYIVCDGAKYYVHGVCTDDAHIVSGG
tara:strand:+ start:4109 stop:4507 length:399 start_codon:yes stop_codon:yes gene_type:complete